MKVDKILHSFNCCSSWSILADMDGSNGCCFSGATNHECGSQACCNILESPGKLEEELTPVHTYANLPKLPEESSSNGVKVGQHTRFTVLLILVLLKFVEQAWYDHWMPFDYLTYVAMENGRFIDDVWWFRYQDALKSFRHNKPWCLSIVVCMQPAPNGPTAPGISSSSAPKTQELMTPEPSRPCVREECCAEFTLSDEDWGDPMRVSGHSLR